jgi:hypothetical protein
MIIQGRGKNKRWRDQKRVGIEYQGCQVGGKDGKRKMKEEEEDSGGKGGRENKKNVWART